MEKPFKFHISLSVSDIEQSVTFYKKLFGTEPVKVKEDYAKFELDNPGLVISFIQRPDAVRPDFGHLGFRVDSNESLQMKKKELSQLLTISLEEENTACCYATQNKFWINDPDGYEWEVYHFIEDIPENKNRIAATTCC